MCTVQRNFFMAKLSFSLFAINFLQRPGAVFRIAIDGNFQRLSPSLSAGKRGYTSRKEHTCVELKRPFYTSPHEILRAAQASKETNKQRVIHAATFIRKVFLISEVSPWQLRSKRINQTAFPPFIDK